MTSTSLDNDAKYLKRKVKAGNLDVHPTEKALVVNYELEATILGEMGDPMLGERKECQKIIRLKSLSPDTDVEALAREVIDKCKLIHPSKQGEVEQLLYYLQNRKEKSSAAAAVTAAADSAEEEQHLRVNSGSMHRYSPVDGGQGTLNEVANINNLDEYIELLYEDVSSKVRGSQLILQLARNPDNLEELSQNETLLGALSRVLREEWKTSIELTTNIVYVFFCLSTFSQFHPIVSRYKVGSLVMDIVEYELGRYHQYHEEYVRKKKRQDRSPQEAEEFQRLEAKFNDFLMRQEQTLRVSFYLLLNLAEDVKVEEKMKKKHIVRLLVSVLNRSNDELLILAVSFLKKLSCYAENKDQLKELGIIEKLVPLLSSSNADLVNAVVRLVLNLSFDSELRQKMLSAGMLPRLVAQLDVGGRSQTPVYCVLYHLSMDDKAKSMFTYTDCIPLVMRRILETTDEQVELEVMALAINLVANKRNAQLICEGHGLRVLMQRAFHYQDALIMKMIRNISQHDGMTKSLFVEFIGDIADAVQRADLEEFRIECLGILGNLTIPDLDYERMLDEYELISWMQEHLEPGRADDDLVLEIVIFVGTCSRDASAAMAICKSGLLGAMIELLKDKQEDDEIVLQVVYVFHLLCSHDCTRNFVLQETDAVAYLVDLMHDQNPQVQRVVDATLDIVAQIDDNWAEKVKRDKFRFHNTQWLEMIQTSSSAKVRNGGDLMIAYGGDDDHDDPYELGFTEARQNEDVDDLEQLVRDTEALEELDAVAGSDDLREGHLMVDSSDSFCLENDRPQSVFHRLIK